MQIAMSQYLSSMETLALSGCQERGMHMFPSPRPESFGTVEREMARLMIAPIKQISCMSIDKKLTTPSGCTTAKSCIRARGQI